MMAPQCAARCTARGGGGNDAMMKAPSVCAAAVEHGNADSGCSGADACAQDVTADDACAITIVFGQLMAIKQDANCMAGCGGGSCPADWYPGGADTCSAECGLVFEPFCKRLTLCTLAAT